MLDKSKHILVLRKDARVRKVAEQEGELLVNGTRHAGIWLTEAFDVESVIKGEMPTGKVVSLRYFIGPTAVSRGVLTRSRCVVFVERCGEEVAGMANIFWLVRDDEDNLACLRIPDTTELPDEDWELPEKVFHLVRQALYTYEPEYATGAFVWLRLAVLDAGYRELALRVLAGIPRRPGEKLFHQVLSVRIQNGDRSAVEEIVRNRYYDASPVGAQILGQAVAHVREKSQVFAYAKELLGVDCPLLREGFAVALGRRYNGVDGIIAVNLLVRLLGDKEPAVRAATCRSLSGNLGHRKRPDGNIIQPTGAESEECVQAWKDWWQSSRSEYELSKQDVRRFAGLEEVVFAEMQ